MKFHIFGTKGFVNLPKGTTVDDLRSLAYFNAVIKNYLKMNIIKRRNTDDNKTQI